MPAASACGVEFQGAKGPNLAVPKQEGMTVAENPEVVLNPTMPSEGLKRLQQWASLMLKLHHHLPLAPLQVRGQQHDRVLGSLCSAPKFLPPSSAEAPPPTFRYRPSPLHSLCLSTYSGLQRETPLFSVFFRVLST